MDDDHDELGGLEAQRVFAKVARSMLGADVSLPTVDRFEVRERLGQGGMGQVYGAHDPETGREVAIKVLRRDRNADPEAIRRMKREARALTRLDHPNVVQVYEAGAVDDGIFFAMELLRGETLADCLEREGRLSVALTFDILAAVCDAIEHAHSLGIIHRDLKPGNIFLADDPAGPRVKVLDFGLAKVVSTGTLEVSTASGTVLGTLYYMSPEQARDSTKLDRRCDLWSVAIIAYECIVGRRPFDTDNLSELAVQLLTTELPTPSDHAAVPVGFDAWFARATHREIDRRYSTAKALAVALADALGRPRPTGFARPRWGRWWLVSTAVGGTFAAVVAWGLGREPARDDTSERVTDPAPGVASVGDHRDADVLEAEASPGLPATIEVEIEGAPPDATVWLDDVQVGVASRPILLERGGQARRLRIEAPGFGPATLEVVPDRDRTQPVELEPRPSPSGDRARPSKDTKNTKNTKSDVEDLEF